MRRRALFFSGAGAAALAAALAAANLLSYRLFARADLSANGSYSISRGTKDLVRGLQDTLTVKVYYSSRLPPPYSLDRQYLKDLLAEYKSAGRGRVRVEFLDPDDEKRRREAMAAGVGLLRLSVTGRDKFEIKEALMGAVLLYRGKTEVIPVIDGVSDLEYDITRRIKKLASDRAKTVGLVTGHGEAAPAAGSQGPFFSQLREQLSLLSVPLAAPVPAAVDALWILGPTGTFSPAELERLQEWLGSGKSLGLLLSQREVDLRSLSARPLRTGLDALLGRWGLEVPAGFVVDAQAERIQMESAYGPFRAVIPVEYPFIPVATSLNRGHPALGGLEEVSFPFAHAIRRKPGARAGLTYTTLADSSRQSWLRGDASVRPGASIAELATQDRGPFSLAGLLEGDFSQAAVSTGARAAPPRAGRLILVGTAQQLLPQFAKGPDLAFLMNLFEWSVQDEALLAIRSKAAAYRPLRPLPGAAVLLAKYSLILFLPLALAAGGLARLARRKAARRELARSYDDP